MNWSHGIFLVGFGFLVGVFSAAGCGGDLGASAPPVQGPPVDQTLLYHASFPSSEILVNGSATSFGLDGRVILNTGLSPGSWAQSGFVTVPVIPVDVPGTFLSARATFNVGDPGHVAQVILGAPGSALAANYFGFRSVGVSLYGVTGSSTNPPQSTDLGTTLSSSVAVNLMAIRRASSVDFYVNGSLKGSLAVAAAANQPTAPYSIAVSNQPAGGGSNASLTVSFLTIGTPMR